MPGHSGAGLALVGAEDSTAVQPVGRGGVPLHVCEPHSRAWGMAWRGQL